MGKVRRKYDRVPHWEHQCELWQHWADHVESLLPYPIKDIGVKHVKDWRDEWRELKPDGEGLSGHHPANYRDSESLQDADAFPKRMAPKANWTIGIPNLALKNLFRPTCLTTCTS